MHIWDSEFSYFLKFSLTADLITQGISSVLFWKFNSPLLNKSVTWKTLIFRVNNFFQCLQITESVRMSKWGWCYFYFISFTPQTNKQKECWQGHQNSCGQLQRATECYIYHGQVHVLSSQDQVPRQWCQRKCYWDGSRQSCSCSKLTCTQELSWSLFLGMVNHLSKFVDYLADKTKPVWDLMQKDSQWVSRTPKQKA